MRVVDEELANPLTAVANQGDVSQTRRHGVLCQGVDEPNGGVQGDPAFGVEESGDGAAVDARSLRELVMGQVPADDTIGDP